MGKKDVEQDSASNYYFVATEGCGYMLIVPIRQIMLSGGEDLNGKNTSRPWHQLTAVFLFFKKKYSFTLISSDP